MPKDKALELECPHCDSAYSLETVQTHEDTVRAVCRCCAKEVVIRNGRIIADARDVAVSDND